MDGTGPPDNRSRLAAFVEDALRRAGGLPCRARADLLRASAEVLRRHLTVLGRPGEVPVHLVGLSAFDLADAADALEAACRADF